jgi:hypothetical protein
LQTTLKKRPKTEKRGTSDEYMTTVDDVDITSLIWKDNKYVTLLSTYAGSLGVKLPIAYAMLLSTLLLNEADHQELEAKRRRGNAQHVSRQEIRTDQVGHWPVFAETRTTCKFPKYKGITDTICEKCGIILYLGK